MKSLILSLLLTTIGIAAPVTWSPSANIAADTDVSTAGNAVFDYDWKSAAQSVNGVAVTAPAGGVTLGWNGGSTHGSFVTDAGTALPAYGLSAAYKNILNGARYAVNGSACTVTLNNLIDSRSYEVQIWVHDPRIYGPGRSETVTSGGGMGQFTIGTFTADAATQIITLTGNSSGSTQINALQLRDVTTVPPSGPAITVQPQSQSVALGADSTGANLFSGAMARSSFYDRVLTPAEITALATGTPNSDLPSN